MTLRSTISEVSSAFLKRRSLVRIQPGTPLLPKDLLVEPTPGSPPNPVENRVSGTNSVQGPNPYGSLSRRWREDVPNVVPAWLLEARAHIRQHYPADGLTESVLWALAGAGFGVAHVPEAPESDEDVMAGLRKVSCP